MTVLLCPVRPGDSNEELRYAIRSWETLLALPGGWELWTVGYQPSWLRADRHIPGNRYTSSPHAVFDNVLLGAREAAAAGVDHVIYMNDDFFCLDPVGAVLPVRRNVSLREQLSRFPGTRSHWWPRSLSVTLDWLTRLGYDDPHSYEVHRPFVADPHLMVNALTRWLDDPIDPDMVPQWRTVYGTVNEVAAFPVRDGRLSKDIKGIGTPWVSTTDQTWRIYARSIRKRFPVPSRYEVG